MIGPPRFCLFLRRRLFVSRKLRRGRFSRIRIIIGAGLLGFNGG